MVAYDLSDKMVIGVASSALFDLTESDHVFRTQGEDAYRRFQEEHVDETLAPGVAFPFIARLLSLNDLVPGEDKLVEVIVLSRNDPETGLRVMRSIEAHGLPITRAVFMQGRSPFQFIESFGMALFLSANGDDVREAVQGGLPAGQVVGVPAADLAGRDLRIAFDFDGVLADDESERVMHAEGLQAFTAHEVEHMQVPLREGHLAGLLRGINRIQAIEDQLIEADPDYNRRVHVSIVTARSAPAHERVIHTLREWNLRVNDAFFLGGVDKAGVLATLRPHIFFDDQLRNVNGTAVETPSVHVPFGIANSPSSDAGA